ncbi:hypothetical protein M2135_000968 [Parabacteroides sp. PF5-9]|nr:hypothetical protein [Parabacteroides sp. PF5-9]
MFNCDLLPPIFKTKKGWLLATLSKKDKSNIISSSHSEQANLAFC